MFPNIKRKIAYSIEEYFDNEFFLDESDSLEDVLLAIDHDAIADLVMKNLESNIFTFDSENYAHDRCHTCQKPFCDFVSDNGSVVQADDLLVPGTSIILD